MHGRYLFRNETLTGIELVGSLITLVSICFVKVQKPSSKEGEEDGSETKYEAVPADPMNWAEEAIP